MKVLGTLFVIFVCILMLPVGLGIVGTVFGVFVGVIGGLFGAVFGVIGGIFGAVFGFFGWIFDGLFNWHWPFGIFHCNLFTVAVLAVIVALIIKSKSRR